MEKNLRIVSWNVNGLRACARKAFIWPEVTGSDHCPVGVDLDSAVMD